MQAFFCLVLKLWRVAGKLLHVANVGWPAKCCWTNLLTSAYGHDSQLLLVALRCQLLGCSRTMAKVLMLQIGIYIAVGNSGRNGARTARTAAPPAPTLPRYIHTNDYGQREISLGACFGERCRFWGQLLRGPCWIVGRDDEG